MATIAPSVARDLLSITPADVKALSRQQKLTLLRDIQTQQQRCPALLLLLCTDLIKTAGSALGDELYAVHEACLIASLDCGNIELALEHHTLLSSTFGRSSVRVRRLGGLIQEAAGRNEAAITTYLGILKDAPGDAGAVKRLAAMRKSVGDYSGAIDMLENELIYSDEDGNKNRFLDYHSMDLAALRELVALHLRVGNLPRAVFYAEEIVLVEPHIHLNHVRLAELSYAQGRLDQAAVSYAHALRLNDGANCARSLYGLWIVTAELKKGGKRAVASTSSSSAAAAAADGEVVAVSAENAAELHSWAAAKLKTLYHGSPLAAALDLVVSKAA